MTDIAATTVAGPSIDQPTDREDVIFFDNGCGLCHMSVRFMLRHETPTSAHPKFAPLFGETFERRARHLLDNDVPDSVHVLTPEGRLLNRSRACIHLARGLGGGWARLGAVASWCPRVILDLGYRFVAAVRNRLFKPPESACPIVPEELRSRFLP